MHRTHTLPLWLPFLACLLCGVLVMVASTSAHADTLLQTFRLKEAFNVAHPSQVVDFDLNQTITPSNCYLLGPTGTEVPYQKINGGTYGKIAVVTDLPAGADRTWLLYSGHAPMTTNAVQVTTYTDYYEITNGLTGVRVNRTLGNPSTPRAPIQGVRMRNNSWTATGPNRFHAKAHDGTPLASTGMTVTILEQGFYKTVMQVTYSFNRPLETWSDGTTTTTTPAGAGHYTSTITVEAGQPSIDIEEDADIDISGYDLNLNSTISATNSRYRGYLATSPANGYEQPNKQQAYRTIEERHYPMDATVDFAFAGRKDYTPLPIYDYSIQNGGWYWQLYNDSGDANANIIGAFAGRQSLATYAGSQYTGVNVFTDAAGVTDLMSQLDSSSRMHVVYQSGDALYYVRFDSSSSLTPTTPVCISSSSERNPNLALLSTNGASLSVVAYNQDLARFDIITSTDSGATWSAPAAVSLSVSPTITDPYAYQACNATTQFLLVNGVYNNITGLHLFSRPLAGGTFTYRQSLDGYEYSQSFHQVLSKRPSFSSIPNGRILLVYAAPGAGGQARRAVIEAGQTTFSSIDPLGGGPEANATAIDPATGNAICIYLGMLYVSSPSWTTGTLSGALTIPSAAPFAGDNRHTYATKPTGEAVAVSGSGVDGYGQLLQGGGYTICRYVNGAWEVFTAANALGLHNTQVCYQPANGKFLLVGRKDGKLALYWWGPGDGDLTLKQQLDDTAQNAAGFHVGIARYAPVCTYPNSVHYAWGLFAGVKGADLPAVTEYQPIAKQMNLHAGVNLNKVGRYELTYYDPARPYGARYMDSSIINGMISRVRTDNAYYNYLLSKDSSSFTQAIINMWHDPTTANVQTCATDVTDTAHEVLNAYVNQDGIYDFAWKYWIGGEHMNNRADSIDQLLSSQFVTALTQNEKEKVKASAALFGYLLWDDDISPMRPTSGAIGGTPNMPVQLQAFRDNYALLLSAHPVMSTYYVPDVKARTSNTVLGTIAESGAHISCAHYIQAGFTPTNTTELVQRMNAAGDNSKNPYHINYTPDGQRLTNFAEFYLNLMTPKEVRFGGKRKVVSIGDSCTEGSSLFGELASGFKGTNDTLAQRLMGAWYANGNYHTSGNFGPTIFRIDENAPSTSPALGNATFPGWASMLRNAYDTDQETAIFFINGDVYSDHRHEDQGALSIYALGAPLAMDWGSYAYPHVQGAYIHSMVVPTSTLPTAWDADNCSLNGPTSVWKVSTQDNFLSFGSSAQSAAHFTDPLNVSQWNRSVDSIHPNAIYPVILIRDTFSGAVTTADKVFTLNMMATGSVNTPGGSITPATRFWDNNNSANQQLPSTGTVFTVPSGVQRFAFTGQQFGTAGVTPAIDWDLYTVSSTDQQALIGNWGNNYTTDGSDYSAANGGAAYTEKQHILRIKSNGAFKVLILPYRKGQSRTQTVTENAGVVTITAGTEVTNIADTYYSFTSTTKDVLTTYNSTLGSAYSISAQGGPTEVVYDKGAGTITITAHGAAGQRTIGVPGTWTLQSGSLTWDSGQGKWLMSYAGGNPATAILGNGTTQVCATPTFSPGTGTYTTAQTVTISSTDGATIRFTTDGTEPTSSSSLYSTALNIATTTTLKARAFKTGYTDSAVGTAFYTISENSTEWQDVLWGPTGTPNVNVATSIPQAGEGSQVLYDGTGTNGWDARAVSTLTIPGDGAVEFQLTNADANKYAHIALTTSITAVGALSETYSCILMGNSKVYEYLNQGQGQLADADTTSIFTMARTGNTVTLAKGGTVVYTYPTQSTAPLYVQIDLTQVGTGYRKVRYRGAGGSGTPTCATPTFSPAAGTYTTAQTVTISSTDGATIRYTTNGTDPTSSSTLYSTALNIATTTTLKARAFKSGYTDSAVGTASYTISDWQDVLWTQTQNVATSIPQAGEGSQVLYDGTGGAWDARAVSTLTIPGDGAVEFQLTNADANKYAHIALTTSITAVGALTETYSCILMGNSKVYEYLNQGQGQLADADTTSIFTMSRTGNTVTLAKNGTVVYTYPTQSTAPLYVQIDLTQVGTGYRKVRYRGAGSGTQTCATPTFSLGTGTYTTAQTVTISCTTPEAAIRFTTDGTDPTSSSALYSTALNIATTTTLKARAFKSGYTDSAVASATYTISEWQDVLWGPTGTPNVNVATSIPQAGEGSQVLYDGTGTNGWDARAVSTLTIPGDGAVEFQLTNADANKYSHIALTTSITAVGALSETYSCILMGNSKLYEYLNQGQGQLADADTTSLFRISRTGNTVTLLKNGTVVYTYPTQSTAPLYVQIDLTQVGTGYRKVRYRGAQ
ncbi:MAG: chitobiase/beta-hexosaminidase C-terminal domain-containing protein [Armatimonadota bacterium]